MSRGIFRQLGPYDFAAITTEAGTFVSSSESQSDHADVAISLCENGAQCEEVWITAPNSAVKYVRLRWNFPLPKRARILGDAWERGYGDLEWRGISGSRYMPWYFMISSEDGCCGYGVKTRPATLCYWQADQQGITLVLDVRCGGRGVLLGERKLLAAEIICMEWKDSDSFAAATEFCAAMCPDPIAPEAPVYGSNNWYYAYGDSSETEILKDTDYLLSLTEGIANDPYMIIDDGWQVQHRLNQYNGGPWTCGNYKFPDMRRLSEKIRTKGARPGIWVRLLTNNDERIPAEWRLANTGNLDPSHPDALEYIRGDVERLCKWGYTLIKHDFSTYDLLGRWGFEMNPYAAGDGWSFYDRSKTSAEILILLYRAILTAAQPYNALILGCNTMGHLGAGLMQISRIGDDTSGLNWERTRRMGVNSLAFRLPQHKTFFDIDADCVGITGAIPWTLNRQWADLLAETGTPLFLSVKPGILDPHETAELREILRKAAAQKSHKRPLDWEDTDCPVSWGDSQGVKSYMWYDKAGSDLSCKKDKFYAFIPVP